MLTQQYINLNALKTFERLAKMNNKVFLENFQHKIPAIIENLPKIQITGAHQQNQVKPILLNLFFWLKLEKVNLDQFEQTDELKYIKNIVSLRAFV